jgi:hypothetical protein
MPTPTRQLTAVDNNGTNFNLSRGFITADDANLNSNLDLNIAARDEKL